MSALDELADILRNHSQPAHFQLRCSVTTYRVLQRAMKAPESAKYETLFGIPIIVEASYAPDRWRILKDGMPYKEYIPNTISGDGGILIDHTKIPKYLPGVSVFGEEPGEAT